MKKFAPFQLLALKCFLTAMIQSAAAEDSDIGDDFFDSMYDALVPSQVEETFENITQEISETVDNVGQEIEDGFENVNQAIVDIDFSEVWANLTIPEELIGVINVDVLFSAVFGEILGFFGVPGYEEYQRVVDSPLYSEPVPFGSHCQFCDGDYDRAGEFAGLMCEEWEIFAGFSHGPECAILRSAGVKHCGCDTWDYSTEEFPRSCPLCPKQSQNDNLPELFSFDGADRVLPTLSNRLRCSNALGLPPVDGETETCGNIAKLSEFCGCDLVIPQDGQCTLCPVGVPQYREKLVLHGDESAGTSNLTCAQLHNQFASKENLLAGDPYCTEEYMHVSNMMNETEDLRTFCGCPAEPIPADAEPVTVEHCQPCEPGYMVRLDGTEDDPAFRSSNNSPPQVTCRDWGDEIQALRADNPVCLALSSSLMPGCCTPMHAQPQEEDETMVIAAKASPATLPATSSGLIVFSLGLVAHLLS